MMVLSSLHADYSQDAVPATDVEINIYSYMIQGVEMAVDPIS